MVFIRQFPWILVDTGDYVQEKDAKGVYTKRKRSKTMEKKGKVAQHSEVVTRRRKADWTRQVPSLPI